MKKEITANNLLSIVDKTGDLVLGIAYLFDDEAAAVLNLIEIFISRRHKT